MTVLAEYKYDVFISFCCTDQEWVQRELLPHLEEAGISFHHQLQFELGRPQLDEIERAIIRSRKTLLILSPDYLASSWRQFDSILVSSYGLEIDEWRAVPVIIRPCDLPNRLRALTSVNLHNAGEETWQRLVDDLLSSLIPPDAGQQVTSKGRKAIFPSSERAGKALIVLSELMQLPEVRAQVVAFQVDFQAACDQVETLRYYKELHDLLHRLQVHCYDCIVQESKRFPDDELAVDNLMEYGQTLQEIIKSLEDTAKRASFATHETLWIKDLDRAKDELNVAIANLNAKRLEKVVRYLNRVLAIYPAQINTRLNDAARALRLPELVKAMEFVLDKLVRFHLDTEKMYQFEIGVEALASLNDDLTALIHDHDQWQEIDLELRVIEAVMKHDLAELETSWPQLKAKVEALYTDSTDKWTMSLKEDSEGLDNALTAENPAIIRRYFRRYRRQISNRFYQVDVNLKRLCEDLRMVGEPLAFVTRLMS